MTLSRRHALRLVAAAPLIPLATAAQAANHVVRITNFTFQPQTLQIAAGDTVTFVNEDSAPHTATAEGLFDTGRLNGGQQASLTFGGAGTFNYICAIHPRMTGSIVVR